MPLRLSDLPHEVVEMIVCQLECRDICNLRLVNCAIDAASTQAYYKSFFVSDKTVELGSSAVSKLADFIQHSRFAAHLQGLKLTAGTESRDQGTTSYASLDADLLRRTFRSLCKLHRQPHQYCLRSLSAEIARDTTRSRRLIFMPQSESDPELAAAALAAKTALRLVNDSDMPIEQLHFLYHSMACSVPCCIFEDPFGSDQPSFNWSRLRCLSLSLTQHVRASPEVGIDEGDDEPTYDVTEESTHAGDRRVQAVVDFFSLIPNIEQLNLHWYGSRIPLHTLTAAEHAENDCFDKLFLAISFHKLKNLTLRGLYTTQAALLKILTTPSLEQVHLACVHLNSSFRPILDCITSPDTALTQFHLHDIDEYGKLIHFAVPRSPKISSTPGVPLRSCEVLRKGEEVFLPLKYGFVSRLAVGGPQLALFRRRQREGLGRV
jgi:hypothetical protein